MSTGAAPSGGDRLPQGSQRLERRRPALIPQSNQTEAAVDALASQEMARPASSSSTSQVSRPNTGGSTRPDSAISASSTATSLAAAISAGSAIVDWQRSHALVEAMWTMLASQRELAARLLGTSPGVQDQLEACLTFAALLRDEGISCVTYDGVRLLGEGPQQVSLSDFAKDLRARLYISVPAARELVDSHGSAALKDDKLESSEDPLLGVVVRLLVNAAGHLATDTSGTEESGRQSAEPSGLVTGLTSPALPTSPPLPVSEAMSQSSSTSTIETSAPTAAYDYRGVSLDCPFDNLKYHVPSALRSCPVQGCKFAFPHRFVQSSDVRRHMESQAHGLPVHRPGHDQRSTSRLDASVSASTKARDPASPSIERISRSSSVVRSEAALLLSAPALPHPAAVSRKGKRRAAEDLPVESERLSASGTHTKKAVGRGSYPAEQDRPVSRGSSIASPSSTYVPQLYKNIPTSSILAPSPSMMPPTGRSEQVPASLSARSPPSRLKTPTAGFRLPPMATGQGGAASLLYDQGPSNTAGRALYGQPYTYDSSRPGTSEGLSAPYATRVTTRPLDFGAPPMLPASTPMVARTSPDDELSSIFGPSVISPAMAIVTENEAARQRAMTDFALRREQIRQDALALIEQRRLEMQVQGNEHAWRFRQLEWEIEQGRQRHEEAITQMRLEHRQIDLEIIRLSAQTPPPSRPASD
ncbi:uncharacterized protein L969DRAFT_506208 [Mixia osmundae IAM 14324]|uniref:Uncharacterized protein n=1 Tax=Mixia osmundae (strain CBS 9802 / IAM 14324 / JCM 22182 / KY 12970) TaxID=764103 RepID=G7E6U4_MIXOS|nr:uncharacterized protein L969DRAFT_506208 [Mixia osmundae IAM 14324]KEI39064.1 hypothetical protein L969DRAFT_506208 [Mixia osmundae IAM 14324]GAA98554.1 hypothetical protein E5Q_05241 [Mixia osmundae IAM 14324]